MIKELIRDVMGLKVSDDSVKINSQCWGYNAAVGRVIEIIEPYKVYDELIDKVSSWWDENPAEIFTREGGDEGAVKVTEIKELLDKIKALSERSGS